MALNIKNREVERLAAEVAGAAGETKTEAIRQALLERKKGLGLPSIEGRLAEFKEHMEREVWSKLPPGVRGKRMTKAEREEILGYGPDGFSE